MAIEDDNLTAKLKKAIQSIAEKEHFIKHSVEKRLLVADGCSFLGTLREVTIRGETISGHKELHLFIKTIIPNSHLAIYNIPDAYNKETFAYKDLFKVFNEIQREFSVPLIEKFVTIKCYDESDSNSIIMENLTKRGFKTCDRMEIMPLKFAKLSVMQLAKFHGLSIVLKEKRPEYFLKNLRPLKVPFTYGEDSWTNFVENLSNLGLSCLDGEARKRAEKYIPTTFEKYKMYTTDPSTMRCLVHGDYRINNIMARYTNGEITEVVPIDYQLIYYGCPIIDLIYFIFGGSDQDFRKKHMEYLKELYHSTMSCFLSFFDMEVEDHYPKKEFQRLFRERLDFGLMFSLWYIPVILSVNGEIPDVTKISCADAKLNLNDNIKSRVRGIVADFMDWGYL